MSDISNVFSGKGSESGLEGKLKGYKPSVIIGQLGGLAATYAGVSNPQLISKYIPALQPLTTSTTRLIGLGALANFVGDQIGFATSLYTYNRDKYKGLKGKYRFVKDFGNLGIRHLGGYAITYPLAAAASYLAIATGFLTGALAITAPYVLESIITGLGYFFSTKRYRKTAYGVNPT